MSVSNALMSHSAAMDISASLADEEYFMAFRLADSAMNVVVLGHTHSGTVTDAVGSYLLGVLHKAEGDLERKMLQAMIEYFMSKSRPTKN